MISIFILTLNEEQNIGECIRSVGFADDVIVLDSFSKDNTVGEAEALGATVYQREFDNWAAHQNWAMKNIQFKNDWVFYLDADERMTKELRDEILAIAGAKENKIRGYFVRIELIISWGKPITHCYPSFIDFFNQNLFAMND